MPTVKLWSTTLLTIAATAALTGFRPAPAATTWTVQPGGKFTGAAATLTMTDTTAKQVVTCVPAGLSGTLKKGSKLPGAGLGTITSFTAAKEKCTGPGGIVFTLTGVNPVKWPLNAVSYNAAKGMTSGTITHIHFGASGSGCVVTVDGTGATANNGMVKITYTNTGAKLQLVKATGNLHLYNVSAGCGGIVKSGDAVSLSATYTLAPPQKITSP